MSAADARAFVEWQLDEHDLALSGSRKREPEPGYGLFFRCKTGCEVGHHDRGPCPQESEQVLRHVLAVRAR